ncbi:CCT motif family protein [Actinidia rufa]|uniref:CCT motif family protein n=1 Tax=Actinidia rufa TaxID=165716 RepID=A0A7J0E5E3_9ERIC|nr:CCT motif family protein [Actinidia rufa]
MEIQDFEDYYSKGMMFRNAANPPEQFPIEEHISSPLPSAQIFELCDPELLFQEPFQNSQVTPNLSFDSGTKTTPTATNNNSNDLSEIYNSPEEMENGFSLSIPFSMSQLFSQTPNFNISNYPCAPPPLPLLPSCFEENDSPLMPRLESSLSNSCNFLNNFRNIVSSSKLAVDCCGIFTGGDMLENASQRQGFMEFQGDKCGTIFYPDPFPSVYNSTQLQALSNESEDFVNGGGSSTTNPLASSLEGSNYFKVSKLSVQERKEKIHRYLKKRTLRNFTKKIKYACRKMLADSRPRVRGRFAKNDEFNLSDTPRRRSCSN